MRTKAGLAFVSTVAFLAATVPASGASTDVDWDRGGGPANMSVGLPSPPGWYRAAVGPRSRDKVLYLTFDDGPAVDTPRLLRALRRYEARATFFVLGGAVTNARATVRRMKSDGHAVAVHTWSHPRLTEVPMRTVRRELLTTRRAIGAAAAPCMRPPYGLIDSRVARVALRADLQPIFWTAHIEDWNPHPMQWTVNRLKSATSPGAVILMHDTHEQTVAAVERLLPWWKRHGYRMAVVPACEMG